MYPLSPFDVMPIPLISEHLTDDYTRHRVNHFVNNGKGNLLTEKMWSSPKTHRHFKDLKNVTVTATDGKTVKQRVIAFW